MDTCSIAELPIPLPASGVWITWTLVYRPTGCRPAMRAALDRFAHAWRSPVAVEDFIDPESQRVLAAAACAVARELGREAAREYFAEVIGTSTTVQ